MEVFRGKFSFLGKMPSNELKIYMENLKSIYKHFFPNKYQLKKHLEIFPLFGHRRREQKKLPTYMQDFFVSAAATV